MWKYFKPKLCEVIGAPKQRYIVKELYVGDASLQPYGPSKWVWWRLEIKQNHWNILKRSCISYQFTADVQTMKQQRLMCALKNARLLLEVCCCLKGSEIHFRINILPQLTTAGLNGEGPWLGLPGHRTSHQWTSVSAASLLAVYQGRWPNVEHLL